MLHVYGNMNFIKISEVQLGIKIAGKELNFDKTDFWKLLGLNKFIVIVNQDVTVKQKLIRENNSQSIE